MTKNTLWVIGSGIAVLFFLLLNGFFPTYEIIVYPEPATAATTSAVTVSASVAAVISCSTDTGSTVFGTLTDASIFTASPNASTTMSCANSALGCTLYVKDAGGGGNPGLWNSTSSAIIGSASAAYADTATLAAGTVGYGIQAASTTAGSGALLTFATRYYQTGDAVGGFEISNTTVASTTATSSNREVVATHKAAISSATAGGDYNDTVTYECTAN